MASKMSSGLPTPPTEECKPVLSSRRTTKSSKTSSRGTKRNSASLSQEPKEIVMDGRHKRVWKACERCRMKKTKVSQQLFTISNIFADLTSAMENHLANDVKTTA
jgi:hypothetical protein